MIDDPSGHSLVKAIKNLAARTKLLRQLLTKERKGYEAEGPGYKQVTTVEQLCHWKRTKVADIEGASCETSGKVLSKVRAADQTLMAMRRQRVPGGAVPTGHEEPGLYQRGNGTGGSQSQASGNPADQ